MNEIPIIPNKTVADYRRQSYHWDKSGRISSIGGAVNFVNERGITFFWPVSGVALPNLWEAAAGHRPVPNNHDDPGHITWRWKDDLIGQRKWYYAKILRRKSTIVSLSMIPYFLAITPTSFYDSEDLTYLYHQGHISREELEIHTALIEEGPLDTISLWKIIHNRTGCPRARFNRALILLQKNLLIIADEIAQAGRWKYAYVYRLVKDVFPDLIIQAGNIPLLQARQEIVISVIRSNGMDHRSNLQKILQWDRQLLKSTVSALLTKGLIAQVQSEHGLPGYAIPEII